MICFQPFLSRKKGENSDLVCDLPISPLGPFCVNYSVCVRRRRGSKILSEKQLKIATCSGVQLNVFVMSCSLLARERERETSGHKRAKGKRREDRWGFLMSKKRRLSFLSLIPWVLSCKFQFQWRLRLLYYGAQQRGRSLRILSLAPRITTAGSCFVV